MKKIWMATLLGCGCLSVMAQSEGELRWGITSGLNVVKLTNVDADCRLGWNLGARVEYGLLRNVYAGSGILLNMKGFEYGDSNHLRGNPLYLEIPIHIGYNYHLTDGISFFGETGPYLAFGLGGKLKQNDSMDLGKEKVDYFGGDGASRFDLGWGMRVGMGVRHLQIHMSYDYGFLKVFDSYFGGASNHNSNFSVGFSYLF